MPADLRLGCFEPEQRRGKRFRVGRRGRLLCPAPAAGQPAEASVLVRDVSAEGVGIVHTEPLAVGHLFVLVLTTRAGREVRLACRIVRCERAAGGGIACLIGARVVACLPEGGGESAAAADGGARAVDGR
jgi:hypothetical protein